MPFARPDIRNQVRSLIQTWPDVTTLAEDLTDSETGVDIEAGTGVFAPAGSVLEIDSELLRVRSVVTDTLTARRGDRGTVRAAHANGTEVTIHGLYDITNVELNRFIRDAINWLYPVCCLDIWDDTTTTAASTRFYPVPDTLEVLEELLLEDARDPSGWATLRFWDLVGSRVYFPRELPADRALKFHGKGRFTVPATDGDDLDVGDDLIPALVFYTAAQVVKGHELLRIRFTGQSALLEQRSGNVPDLIGSSRELMRQATAARDQFGSVRPSRLRAILRHG